MIRLFVDSPLEAGKTLTLDEGQRHYLRDVMRRTVGEEVALFNGYAGEWLAEIRELSKKTAVLSIARELRPQPLKKRPPCLLCMALVKKEPMDFILQKATEMGVSAIYPMITKRTVVRGFNRARAISLVREAAEQSERLDVPEVFEAAPLEAVAAAVPQGVQPVFLSERGASLGECHPDTGAAYFIGPEGGFTEEEARFLAALPGAATRHLGDTILRAETAALAVVACHLFASDIKK